MPDIGDWPHFIIQSLPDGIITVDGQLQVTDLNRAGENLLGLSRQQALGKYCGEVLRSSLCGQECPLKTAMISGEVVTREAILQDRQGQKIEVMLAAAALRDDQGNLLGGVESFRDIGLFKRMEHERRQLVGMFAHDLKTPVVAAAGLLRRLAQGKVGELAEAQAAYVETISREIARLEKLINNFLDYVRLDLHLITPSAQRRPSGRGMPGGHESDSTSGRCQGGNPADRVSPGTPGAPGRSPLVAAGFIQPAGKRH